MKKEEIIERLEAFKDYFVANLEYAHIASVSKLIQALQQKEETNAEELKRLKKKLNIIKSSIEGSLASLELFSEDVDVIEKSEVIKILKDLQTLNTKE